MKKILVYSLLGMTLLFACQSREEKEKKYLKEGLAKFFTSDNRGAMADFDKVIRYNQANFEAWYYRGCCKFNLRDVKGATDDLNEAIVLKPDFSKAFVTRGEVRFYTGDRDGACSDWRRAGELGDSSMSDKSKFCR